MTQSTLVIKNLKVKIKKDQEQDMDILLGIDLVIKKNESVCIVGESGCGKTVLGLSIIKLLPKNFIMSGELTFLGTDLISASPQTLQKIRGKDIGVVFQDPMSSLNPVFKIGDQVKEVLDIHSLLPQEKRKQRVFHLFKEVGLPATEQFYKRYPHQLSGGQKQRVMIAMAIACNPKLLIADEPTTALDVTVQAQIIKLFQEIITKYQTSLLYITHDLHIVKHIADKIFIMYSGLILEQGPCEKIFQNPLHPYTKSLLDAIPSITKKGKPLKSIRGSVPDMANRPSGCVFHPRCPMARPECSKKASEMIEWDQGHRVRCILYE